MTSGLTRLSIAAFLQAVAGTLKFGIAYFPSDETMNVVELAPRIEELGFESIFVPEHSHIPTSRKSPHPFAAEIPMSYAHFWDPFVALSGIAAVTSTLRLGTGICLIAQHDPIQLAKTVATLDHMSSGRVLLGIGAGWNQEEMENHGANFAQRWGIMRENVQAMRRIWGEDEPEYHGKHVSFDPIWAWPKPAQGARLPILIGGEGESSQKHAAAYGDEWFPRLRRAGGSIVEQIANLQAFAAKAGRERIPVTTFGMPQDAAALEALREAGVHRCVATLAHGSSEEVLGSLKRAAEVVRSLT